MKILFSLILCFLSSYAAATDSAWQVYTLADRSVLKGASWAAAAAYVQEKKPLFSIQPDLRLAPASTLKLLTSAAALEMLGSQHRFQTRIYQEGTIDANGTLNGHLYIRGGADPTLGSDRVPTSMKWQDLLQHWSQKIRSAGIKQINGNIYADVSLLQGLSLPTKTNWQNMGNYFAAPVSALSFNDNSFEIVFKAQPKHGALMQVKSFFPETEGLKIRSFVTADAHHQKDEVYVYAAPQQYNLEIHGTLPTSTFKQYRISAALPDPAQLLTDLLIMQLEKDQIPVNGAGFLLDIEADYSAMRLIYTHQSPPLKDIIYIVNKRSFNLYAETLLRHLALHSGQKATTENGIAALKEFLQKNSIPTDNMMIYDGSGLSRDNQLSVQTLLDVLQFMAKSPNFSHYYNSLATVDDRGDLLLLRRFLTPFKRNKDIHVKGGTLDGVKAQAGYVKDRQGRLIAFAFITNNIIEEGENINRFYEDILKILLQLE
ncbi:MAG: D-alanyl-D-alanine carboxypeptidase/D-alanyl-D-alanine-endopeptidase [Elusimicrobiaceae bacterium]|nr:D-alanyl-D-alanine carboxypeptidase/D-alanyl-D-alanine-endopeptidase [Elusimicrobiaceae bacterium]